MYYVVEIPFYSKNRYIKNIIENFSDDIGIKCDVLLENYAVKIIFEQDESLKDEFLSQLQHILPASIFMDKSSHYIVQNKPNIIKNDEFRLPVNIAPCPTCQKEMFDISSRRYYYPFTSCNNCGNQTPFVNAYPFIRQKTFMKFIVPCQNCQNELKSNHFRIDYPLISCIECGISLKMSDMKNERIANDKGSYRKLFEVCANTINKDKTILAKTLHGYRIFSKPHLMHFENNIAMITNANSINSHFMIIQDELNALLSIERPLLRLSTKSEEAKAIFGSNTWVKYPDDGISMLLAKELKNVGIDYIVYSEVAADTKADFVIDFDIPIYPQKDCKVFVNQSTKKIISGERLSFPSLAPVIDDRVIMAYDLASVSIDGYRVNDNAVRFDETKTTKLYLPSNENYESGLNIYRFEKSQASIMSVLAENDYTQKKALGVYFDDDLDFLYFNQKELIVAIPSREFESNNFFERLKSLREGSDRLAENYKSIFLEYYNSANNNKSNNLFVMASILLGLGKNGLEEIQSKALSFLGKGGIKMDVHIKDNRFHHDALLASIMSYKIANVDTNLICYSIFESFGDYISEIINQLSEKTKCDTVAISGKTISNQILYGRIKRNLSSKKILTNIHYPMDKENIVYGAIYL